jgi:hypothetical protein
MPAEAQGLQPSPEAAQPCRLSDLNDHHAADSGCSMRGPGRGRLALRHHLLPLPAAHVHDVHVVGRARQPDACAAAGVLWLPGELKLQSALWFGTIIPVPDGGPGDAGGPSTL